MQLSNGAAISRLRSVRRDDDDLAVHQEVRGTAHLRADEAIGARLGRRKVNRGVLARIDVADVDPQVRLGQAVADVAGGEAQLDVLALDDGDLAWHITSIFD